MKVINPNRFARSLLNFRRDNSHYLSAISKGMTRQGSQLRCVQVRGIKSKI